MMGTPSIEMDAQIIVNQNLAILVQERGQDHVHLFVETTIRKDQKHVTMEMLFQEMVAQVHAK